MATRLIADTDDDERGFVLYDPQAVGSLEPGIGDWDEKRRMLAGDGRAAVHAAMAEFQSPDHPGTERRIAWLTLDEPLPDEVSERAMRVVEGSRLQVPSGDLYFCGAFAARHDGAPEQAGECFDETEIPPGDYRLDIYLADWRPDERERFVEKHTHSGDSAVEHRLGCLGLAAVCLTGFVPVALVLGYLVPPLLGLTLHPDAWLWTLGGLGILWITLFLLNMTPSQRRLIAARRARDGMGLPIVIYSLTTEPPGERPAFYHEEARDSVEIRRRYGLRVLE